MYALDAHEDELQFCGCECSFCCRVFGWCGQISFISKRYGYKAVEERVQYQDNQVCYQSACWLAAPIPKIKLISRVDDGLLVIKLRRTDTTLDLSQLAETDEDQHHETAF